MNNKKAAIILAAGQGTRMKSTMPKVMHALAGVPMINHVTQTCRDAAIDDVIIVVAPNMPTVTAAAAPHQTVIQDCPLGTGDAVKAARTALKDFKGYIFILCGDCPFIQSDSLEVLYQSAQKTGLSVLGFNAKNPHGYGRFLVSDSDIVTAIVEEKDCSDSQRAITLCNAGVYCVQAQSLFGWLDQLDNKNVQGEYYLTDLIAIAARDGVQCGYSLAKESEVMGINSRAQLAQAEKIIQNRLRDKAMDAGVTMIDPDTVYLSIDTMLANDVVIEPNVFIGMGVSVGRGTVIHAFSHLEGVSIGDNASVGPFARIRPQSTIGNGVSVGNFIEVNRAQFKDGSKSKHLSYIGDAVIGEKTNIGAGTVIANYDGYNKHLSTIGKQVFVGSNSTIISPVTIGDGAMTAAGSVITQDVPKDTMAIGRARQTNMEGKAKAYHEGKKKS